MFSGMTSEVTAIESSLARAYVGSSGFSYSSWKGGFYPAGSKEIDFLAHYADRLPAVEINSTFYQLPSEATFQRWAESTPAGFRFTLKMNRRVTLAGRLELLPTFCEHARLLGDRLGPIRVALDRPRDDGFLQLLLDSLDPELAYAFELRHPSWEDSGNRILAERGIARVDELAEGPGFRYIRLREPPYDERQLEDWSGRIRPLLASNLDVYCFFRHEDEPTAPAYAARLLELLRG